MKNTISINFVSGNGTELYESFRRVNTLCRDAHISTLHEGNLTVYTDKVVLHKYFIGKDKYLQIEYDKEWAESTP